jgi:hypothetical protein
MVNGDGDARASDKTVIPREFLARGLGGVYPETAGRASTPFSR